MSFQFVQDGKIDGNTRKIIRSHVMKGKNVGKIRPRPKPKERQMPVSSGMHTGRVPRPLICKTNTESYEENTVSIRGNVGNEFSFFTFPCEMQPYMRELIFQFMSTANQYVYPTEFCLPIGNGKSIWFEYLLSDEAFFHSVLAMSEIHFDSVLGKQDTSPTTLRHLSNTYRCIRRDLQKHEKPCDSTIATVMSMAIHEDLKGQPGRSKIHIDALERIIQLRGGIAQFDATTPLLQKMCRADIEFALQFGSHPRFNRDEYPRELIRRSLHSRSIHQEELLCAADEAQMYDPELRGIFIDLLSLSRLLNCGHTVFRMEPYAYQEVLISVLYRLLHYSLLAGDGINNDYDNACYLGLLAAISTLFFQYGRYERLSYDVLAMKLRSAVGSTPKNWQKNDPFFLWFLFISGIAVFGHADEPWLYRRIKTCVLDLGINDWPMARNMIKRYPWIDKANDKPGQELWYAIFTH